MNANVYYRIKERTSQIRKLVQERSKHRTVDQLVIRMKNTLQLTSLSLIFKKLAEFSPEIDRILDPPTSGYSSDCAESCEIRDRVPALSYTEVKNILIDTSVFKVIDSSNGVPSDRNAMLIVSKVNEELDYFKFKAFLRKLKKPPSLIQARFFYNKKDYSLLLQFDNYLHAREFYYSCQKKMPHFLDHLGNEFTLQWVKLNSKEDTRNGRPIKRKIPLFSDLFFGVIVRNLPPNTRPEEIQNFLKKNKIEARIEYIYYRKNEYFTLVLCSTLTGRR